MSTKTNAGRPRTEPTATQRRRLARGIAIGLTLEQLAVAIDMPLGTMKRVLADDIKKARIRLILDNLDRLHDAADAGNVAAMKQLATMMQEAAKQQHPAEGDDRWADLVDGVLSQNGDFQKCLN
jgi:hypothetical protein